MKNPRVTLVQKLLEQDFNKKQCYQYFIGLNSKKFFHTYLLSCACYIVSGEETCDICSNID